MSTEYVVLRHVPGDHPDAAGSWVEAATTTASSAANAIRNSADASGAYVAIPKRSFQPQPVEVETAPRVKLVS